MEKLKTLKDLKFTLSNLKLGTKDKLFQNYEVDGSATFINPKELKAEAIKWIQYRDKGISVEKFDIYMPQIVIWIKHFFNITEEELSKNKDKGGDK